MLLIPKYSSVELTNPSADPLPGTLVSGYTPRHTPEEPADMPKDFFLKNIVAAGL